MKKIRLTITSRYNSPEVIYRTFCWKRKDDLDLWREHRDNDLPAVEEYGTFYWFHMGRMMNMGNDRDMSQNTLAEKLLVFYYPEAGLK